MDISQLNQHLILLWDHKDIRAAAMVDQTTATSVPTSCSHTVGPDVPLPDLPLIPLQLLSCLPGLYCLPSWIGSVSRKFWHNPKTTVCFLFIVHRSWHLIHGNVLHTPVVGWTTNVTTEWQETEHTTACLQLQLRGGREWSGIFNLTKCFSNNFMISWKAYKASYPISCYFTSMRVPAKTTACHYQTIHHIKTSSLGKLMPCRL